MSNDLTIVVPARDEARRLAQTVDSLTSYIDSRGSGDIVLAVDHSSADESVAIADRAVERDRRIKHVAVQRRGKGFAVTAGVEAADGEVVLLADADLSVDTSQFDALVAPAATGAMAIATRAGPAAQRIGEPLQRYLLGRAFNTLVRIAVLPGVRDTQCGFKAFPRVGGTALLRCVRAGGWAFDVELLALARRGGMPVHEVPVVWRYGHESTLRPLSDAAGIIGELWGIRRRIGRVA